MKVKLVKCGICDHWFDPKHKHCPACNAGKMIVRGLPFYFNVANGRQMVKSTWRYALIEDHIDSIARILGD